MKAAQKRQTPSQSGIGNRLSLAVEKRQQQIAAYLDRKTQHWNMASKYLFLFVICLLLGTISLSLIIRAFY